MELLIILHVDRLKLEIRQKGRVLDFQEAKYYHDLSRVLISAFDNLLKRTRVDLKSIKSYKILSNLGQNSTSHKITSAFISALKLDA